MDRFWEKIDIHPFAEDLCWEWTAAKMKTGYGQFRYDGSMKQAHRIMYHLFNPEWPLDDKLHVLHQCDNPSCVNPDHLFLGTQEDNNKDKTSKGRQARGLNHRNATASGKKKGSSKYVGVSWNKRYSKWNAKILYKGKSKHLGDFKFEEDAARAYQDAARKIENGCEV